MARFRFATQGVFVICADRVIVAIQPGKRNPFGKIIKQLGRRTLKKTKACFLLRFKNLECAVLQRTISVFQFGMPDNDTNRKKHVQTHVRDQRKNQNRLTATVRPSHQPSLGKRPNFFQRRLARVWGKAEARFFFSGKMDEAGLLPEIWRKIFTFVPNELKYVCSFFWRVFLESKHFQNRIQLKQRLDPRHEDDSSIVEIIEWYKNYRAEHFATFRLTISLMEDFINLYCGSMGFGTKPPTLSNSYFLALSDTFSKFQFSVAKLPRSTIYQARLGAGLYRQLRISNLSQVERIEVKYEYSNRVTFYLEVIPCELFSVLDDRTLLPETIHVANSDTIVVTIFGIAESIEKTLHAEILRAPLPQIPNSVSLKYFPYVTTRFTMVDDFNDLTEYIAFPYETEPLQVTFEMHGQTFDFCDFEFKHGLVICHFRERDRLLINFRRADSNKIFVDNIQYTGRAFTINKSIYALLPNGNVCHY